MAIINDVSGGYMFSALEGIDPGTRLPTQAQMNADAARAGLNGKAHLEYGQTAEGGPRTMPFLVATDANGRAAFVGRQPLTAKFAAH